MPFSILFRLLPSVVRPNRFQVVRTEIPCISVSYCAFAQERFLKPKPFLCEGVLRHRNTRELYSKNLRAVGPNHAQLTTKQNRKQYNKTRHRDQNKASKESKHPCPNTLDSTRWQGHCVPVIGYLPLFRLHFPCISSIGLSEPGQRFKSLPT